MAEATRRDDKRQFDIDEALTAIEEAVRPYPKAALFELAELGFTSPFEQLIACMISIRTRDETTLPTAQRLFERARTPAQMLTLTVDEIDSLIATSSFHEAKARQVHEIAKRVEEEFGGELPCDDDVLQSLPGVGPKCAHLVLGIACRHENPAQRDGPRVLGDERAAADRDKQRGRPHVQHDRLRHTAEHRARKPCTSRRRTD